MCAQHLAFLLVGCLLTGCTELSNLELSQSHARSAGVVVQLVTVYVALGKADCGGNGRQFEYKPTENQRIPPVPINAEYPFK